MAESNDDRMEPKPEDYAGLRAELEELASEFLPLTSDMWQRLENHKYRWQLLHYGLPEGYDKFVVSDTIALLMEALKGLGAADNKLRHAHLLADSHNPNQAGPE